MRVTAEGGADLLKPSAEGAWDPFIELAPEDSLTTSPAGFDKTGRVLYMLDSRGRNTSTLSALDLDTGEAAILAEDPRADINAVMVHPTEKVVEAAASTYERRHWQVLDDSVAGDLDYLRTVGDGNFEVVSRTLDDRLWIVVFLVDDGPSRYYLYHRDQAQADFLFTNRADLEGLPLAKMHPVVIRSRDGYDLVSYYTLPVWSDPNDTGRPDEPLPMVLSVHSGPWARSEWGYHSGH